MLQSQHSIVLQIDSWIFISCMVGKVCSDSECNNMIDLLKFRNKLLGIAYPPIDRF